MFDEVIAITIKSIDNYFSKIFGDVSAVMNDCSLGHRYAYIGSVAVKAYEGRLGHVKDFDVLVWLPDNHEAAKQAKNKIKDGFQKHGYCTDTPDWRGYDALVFTGSAGLIETYFGIPNFKLTKSSLERVVVKNVDGFEIPVLSPPDTIISLTKCQRDIPPAYHPVIRDLFSSTGRDKIVSALCEQPITPTDVSALYNSVCET